MREERSAVRERQRLRRRRVFVLALTLAAVVIQFISTAQDHKLEASARSAPKKHVAAPAADIAPTHAPVTVATTQAAAAPVPSPSPTLSPKGPPFVLDAAPSCAGKTALIDMQVAGTAARPVTKLELFLDGLATLPTPVPPTPLTSYAGRSSGPAAAGGAGQWTIRATDKEGIVDTRVYPYACG